MKKLVLYSLLSCFSATLLGCNSNANDDTIDIVETEQEVSTGITKDLSRDLMYSLNGELRTTSAVMQSFDIISNGSLFYSQLNSNFRAYISKAKPNEKYTEMMTLYYSGHVSNFTIEEIANEYYLWVDNYASKNAKGEYWTSQIISRIKFEDGKVMLPQDAEENYYCGVKNISVAVDVNNDMLTILGISSGDVITYSLSEAKALPIEDITLDPIKYGGEGTNPYHSVEQTESFTVKARDLRKLTPLGHFFNQRIGDVPWQGFDINDGKFYQAEGAGNENDGKEESIAYLTIKNIHGEVVEPRTRVAAISNLKALNLFGVTDTGYMEAEGVKIRRGTLYLGYANKNSENKRYATILKYQPCKKLTPW